MLVFVNTMRLHHFFARPCLLIESIVKTNTKPTLFHLSRVLRILNVRGFMF